MYDDQDARLRHFFNLRPDKELTPRMREVLAELQTVALSQIVKEPNPNPNVLQMLFSRVKKAILGEFDEMPFLPGKTAKVELARVQAYANPEVFDVNSLPLAAYDVYQHLVAKANSFGAWN